MAIWGRMAMVAATAMAETGRSSQRQAMASRRRSSALTLPSDWSLRNGAENAVTAKAAKRTQGRTGSRAQATARRTIRRRYQATVAVASSTAARGSSATARGGA